MKRMGLVVQLLATRWRPTPVRTSSEVREGYTETHSSCKLHSLHTGLYKDSTGKMGNVS